MPFGQSLQGCQHRGHLQIVGIGLLVLRQVVDHEIAYATAIEVGDIAVAVVTL